jgi:putative drug/metabolite transporter DUF486
MIPGSIAAAPWSYLAPVFLLICSNLFMTLTWYGHLKFKSVPLFLVIVVRILLRRPCQQDRERRLFPGRAQDNPGSDHTCRVRGLHRLVF